MSSVAPEAVEGRAEVNGARLWYRITGEGEPVAQIHGAGFGHFNFDLATPELIGREVLPHIRGLGPPRRLEA